MAHDGVSKRKRLSIQSLSSAMRKRTQRSKSQTAPSDAEILPQPGAAENIDVESCDEGPSTSEINEPESLAPVSSSANTVVHTFYERSSGATSYLVADKSTGRAVVIDPILDSSGPGISSTVADNILTAVKENHYHVDRILETQGPTEGKSFAGIQRMFERKYAGSQKLQVSGNIEPDFKDAQSFELGSIGVQVLILPARDPEHTAFVIDSNVFIGDTLLVASPNEIMGIGGTDVVDRSFGSVRKLVDLPSATRIYCSQQLQPSCPRKDWVSVLEIRNRFEDPRRRDV
ncbi:hypothetical protein KC331_g3161 [Hortaea werneckii]|nr:hypothetical protein KC331_g3161 [Hortaea werneckii]KAI7699995.1 hypothetical protein KC353_g16145 [Hortaea werneckii]